MFVSVFSSFYVICRHCTFIFLLSHRYLFHFVEAINVNICRYYEAECVSKYQYLYIHTRSMLCLFFCAVLLSRLIYIYICTMQYTCCCRLPMFNVCVCVFGWTQHSFQLFWGVVFLCVFRSLADFVWLFLFIWSQLSCWFRFVPSSYCDDCVNYMNAHHLSQCSCSTFHFIFFLFLSLSAYSFVCPIFLSHIAITPCVLVRLHNFLCLSLKYFLRNSPRHTHTKTSNKQQRTEYSWYSDKLPSGPLHYMAHSK